MTRFIARTRELLFSCFCSMRGFYDSRPARCDTGLPRVTNSDNEAVSQPSNAASSIISFANQTVTSRFAVLVVVLAAVFLLTGLLMSRALEVDGTREQRVPLRAPLVWDNVTSSSQFAFGVRPASPPGSALSYVTLPPGESVDFLVPAHEMIRVDGVDGQPLPDAAPEIWSSDGSGMYRKLVPAFSSNRGSMVAAPDASALSVAKVFLPEHAPCPLTVAVFTSRRPTLRVQDFYQCRIDNCGEEVEISQDGGQKNRRYSFVQGGRRYRLKAEGPVRLRFESRLKYDADPQIERSSRVLVFAGDVLHRVLLFDTMPQRSDRAFVDDCERIVGGPEFAYLDLDCDDQDISIEVSHAMYLRVEGTGLSLARPQLNAGIGLRDVVSPEQPVSLWNAPDYDPAAAQLNRAFLSGEEGRPQFELDPALDPYLNQQTIQKLARDNSVPHSGLRAYMWMRAIAAQHHADARYGHETTVPQMAARLRGRFTSFRSMHPLYLTPESAPRFLAFSSRRVRTPGEQLTVTTIGEQHVSQLASRLASVPTYPVPAGPGTDGLEFRPPADLGSSVIRLVVDQTHLYSPAVLEVQYDDGLPIELAVVQNSTLSPDMQVPGGLEVALAGLACSFERYDSSTFGGPFAMLNRPVGLVRAGTAELLLPAGVGRIKVRVKSGGDRPVFLGMQYLTSRYQQLSESAYRQHLSTANGATGAIQEFSLRELDNDATRLRDILHSNWRTVAFSAELTSMLEEPASVMNEELAEAVYDQAAESAKSGQWTSTIESLSELVRHSVGERRRDAILARANALESAGEYYLANRERIGWMIHSDDQELRQGMLDQLIREAAGRGHGESLIERYLSYAVMEFDNAENELRLAQQFMRNGKYRMALLMLPPDISGPPVDEVLLRCCLQLHWWKTFEETLKRTDDPVQTNLWQGLKSLRTGDFIRAEQLLQSAGPQGHLWLNHWRTGDEVFESLLSLDPGERLAAVERWESWQAGHPGPVTWQSEPATVKTCAGAASLRSTSTGITSHYFRSEKQTAATIRIHGPVRLRIEGRPVHAAGVEGPEEDWLTITNGSQIERIPILNNRPSDTLRIEGRSDVLPGQRIFAEFDLPAGLNELQLTTLESDLLFSVYALRPEIASPVLPPVNEISLAAVIRGSFGRTGQIVNADRQDSPDLVRMVCLDRTCCSIGFCFPALVEQSGPLHSALGCYDELRFGDARNWQNRVIPAGLPFENVDQGDDYRDAIRSLHGTGVSAEPGSANRLRQIAAMEKILKGDPARRDVRELLNRVKSGYRWRRLKQFDSRAGTRDVAVEGWHPESPALRIRRALAPTTGSDYVLTGSNDLAMRVNDTRWTEFLVSVQQPSISFVPLSRASVVWTAGSESGELVLNGTDEPAEFSIHLPPGENSIQISHGNPLVNHLIRLSIREVMPDGTAEEIGSSRMKAGESRREFTVATRDEPLRFRVAGPTVIRVDKFVDGVVSSELVPVVEEQRAFELLPAADEETALYRVHQLVEEDNSLPTYRPDPMVFESPDHWSGDVVQAVYEQAELLSSSEQLDQLALRRPDSPPVVMDWFDDYAPGTQESGTYGFHFGYRQRRALNEFPSSGTPGRFFEARVSQYKYDPWMERFTANEFFIRPRIGSGPTYGLLHSGEVSFPWQKALSAKRVAGRGPVRLEWNASAFGQYAGTPLIPPSTSTPGSLSFSAAISRTVSVTERLSRRPRLQLFARVLSEDLNRFSPGELDQDVFTRYKSDHPYGFRISDKFVYQRVLDRRFWFRPALTSNSDEFTLDNIGFEAGTDQLLGPLQLQLSYRLTRFNADTHRGVSVLQNVFNIEARFERWRNRNCRSDLAFAIQHDADDGGTSIGLNYSRFLNHGRGYRDFSPDSIMFGAIRQERFASQFIFDEN